MFRWWFYRLWPISFSVAVAWGAAAWANHAVKLEREAPAVRESCPAELSSTEFRLQRLERIVHEMSREQGKQYDAEEEATHEKRVALDRALNEVKL